MTELYLIAHKVRGEPAFDIACKIMIGDEEGWIIPTSGHSAHPYSVQPLLELIELADWPPMPADIEDHYPMRRAADEPKPTGASLLAALGLSKPKPPPIARRI